MSKNDIDEERILHFVPIPVQVLRIRHRPRVVFDHRFDPRFFVDQPRQRISVDVDRIIDDPRRRIDPSLDRNPHPENLFARRRPQRLDELLDPRRQIVQKLRIRMVRERHMLRHRHRVFIQVDHPETELPLLDRDPEEVTRVRHQPERARTAPAPRFDFTLVAHEPLADQLPDQLRDRRIADIQNSRQIGDRTVPFRRQSQDDTPFEHKSLVSHNAHIFVRRCAENGLVGCHKKKLSYSVCGFYYVRSGLAKSGAS